MKVPGPLTAHMPTTQREPSLSSVQSPLETYLREINETHRVSAEAARTGPGRRGDTQARDRMVRTTSASSSISPEDTPARAWASRPDRRGQSRPAAHGRRVRSGHGHPLLDLRELPGSSRSSGIESTRPETIRMHGRVAVEMAQREHAAGRGAWPNAHARGSRPRPRLALQEAPSSRRPSASTTLRPRRIRPRRAGRWARC